MQPHQFAVEILRRVVATDGGALAPLRPLLGMERPALLVPVALAQPRARVPFVGIVQVPVLADAGRPRVRRVLAVHLAHGPRQRGVRHQEAVLDARRVVRALRRVAEPSEVARQRPVPVPQIQSFDRRLTKVLGFQPRNDVARVAPVEVRHEVDVVAHREAADEASQSVVRLGQVQGLRARGRGRHVYRFGDFRFRRVRSRSRVVHLDGRGRVLVDRRDAHRSTVPHFRAIERADLPRDVDHAAGHDVDPGPRDLDFLHGRG